MGVLDYQVSASADDVDLYWNGASWVMYPLASISLIVGYGSAAGLKRGTGHRFSGVTIPSGALITLAYLSFAAHSSDSNNAVNTRITGNKENDPATFSTLADFQARRGTVVGGADNSKITTAQVTWDSVPAWTAGNWYNTPNISSVIQELVDAHAPANEALVLFWDDFDGRSTATNATYRQPYSYDHAPNTFGAKLHIEYGETMSVSQIPLGIFRVQ